MVTKISVAHYCYNIDLYINGTLLSPVEKEKNSSFYVYDNKDNKKLSLFVCQNDRGCNKLLNLFSYYDFGYEFGELYFWPANIYCQYLAEIQAGSDISLCVCVEKDKCSSFIQDGKFIIQSTSESKVKNEKHSTLIPRKKRLKFFISSIICQFICNSLLLLSLLTIILLSADVNKELNFFDDFSGFEKIGFWLLLTYQIVRLIIYVFIHTKILIKDDGTYYSKE